MSSRFAPTRLVVTLAVLTAVFTPAAPAAAAPDTQDGGRKAVMEVNGELCGVTQPIAAPGAADAPPFGVGPCPGVRPGAALSSEFGGCTFNFYWKGYARNAEGQLVEAGRFMGTAGHCGTEEQSEQEYVWAPGQGPPVKDGAGNRIGEYAYAVNSSTKDFALIRLDPGVNANPSMCHFGGPTGIWDPSFSPVAPRVVQHFGQGLVFGDTVSARSGVGYLSDPNWSFGVDEALFGDSGSGVETDDGRAFGVLVAISPLGIVYTRIPPSLEAARKALGLESFELQTAPENP